LELRALASVTTLSVWIESVLAFVSFSESVPVETRRRLDNKDRRAIVAAVSIPAGVVTVVQDRRGAKAAAIDGMLKTNTNTATRRMIPTHCCRSRLSTPNGLTTAWKIYLLQIRTVDYCYLTLVRIPKTYSVPDFAGQKIGTFDGWIYARFAIFCCDVELIEGQTILTWKTFGACIGEIAGWHR
jgi:hypothetical protein